MHHWWRRLLGFVRRISGDDAYERYLAHRLAHHAQEPALDRRAFYLAEQHHKWIGIKRCC